MEVRMIEKDINVTETPLSVALGTRECESYKEPPSAF
jgi:hypothetical protein